MIIRFSLSVLMGVLAVLALVTYRVTNKYYEQDFSKEDEEEVKQYTDMLISDIEAIKNDPNEYMFIGAFVFLTLMIFYNKCVTYSQVRSLLRYNRRY